MQLKRTNVGGRCIRGATGEISSTFNIHVTARVGPELHLQTLSVGPKLSRSISMNHDTAADGHISIVKPSCYDHNNPTLTGHLIEFVPSKERTNSVANLMSVLNEKIARIARREIKAKTKGTKNAATRYRHDIADLKRQVAVLTQRLAMVEKRQPLEAAPPPEVLENARFRADSVKSHRAKLGLSAAAYGKLVGVSSLTVYKWEAGKSRPRKTQLSKFLAVRGIGKRETLQRLGIAGPKGANEAPAARSRPRD